MNVIVIFLLSNKICITVIIKNAKTIKKGAVVISFDDLIRCQTLRSLFTMDV